MRVAFRVGVLAVAFAAGIAACLSTTQQQDAEKGVRVACAALVESMAQGIEVPHEPIVKQACDVDRTKATIQALIQIAKDSGEDFLLDWQEPSPPAPSDAGAR